MARSYSARRLAHRLKRRRPRSSLSGITPPRVARLQQLDFVLKNLQSGIDLPQLPKRERISMADYKALVKQQTPSASFEEFLSRTT